MLNRPYLALPALAGAMLAASLGAFAQTVAPPAGPYGPSGGPAYAQPGSAAQQPGHRHRRRGPLQRALKGLALSPAQRSRIGRLMHDYRMSRKSGNPETRAQVIAQIRGVLSPEERSRFEQRLQRMQRKDGGRAQGGYPGSAGNPNEPGGGPDTPGSAGGSNYPRNAP